MYVGRQFVLYDLLMVDDVDVRVCIVEGGHLVTVPLAQALVLVR